MSRVGRVKAQKGQAGQALIELALILPLLLILIMNVVNFAGFFQAFIVVGNASRAAGDYTVMGSVAYSGTTPSGASAPPFTAPTDQGITGAQLVANMLKTDMLPLKNNTSINVRLCRLNPSSADIGNATCNVCTNSSGSMSCAAGSGSFSNNPTPDTTTGEGDTYTLTWVDVSYTYNPFIPAGFNFPGLGFGITLPSNLVLHRQSVYRVLN